MGLSNKACLSSADKAMASLAFPFLLYFGLIFPGKVKAFAKGSTSGKPLMVPVNMGKVPARSLPNMQKAQIQNHQRNTVHLKRQKEIYVKGSLQITGKDELAYQEMLVHLPLCSIPNPKKVLVIGGGDGSNSKEISRHSSVEEIHVCELDEIVIDAYKKFFPELAIGLTDPRVTMHIGDGIEFLESASPGTYDAIIIDAFQQMGTLAEELADASFLQSVARALRPGDVMCCPADSLWKEEFSVIDTIESCRKIFGGAVSYAWCSVPSYPSGMIGHMLCSTEGPPVDFKHPVNPLNPDSLGVAEGPPKFYSSEVHTAAFCLPPFPKERRFLPNGKAQALNVLK